MTHPRRRHDVIGQRMVGPRVVRALGGPRPTIPGGAQAGAAGPVGGPEALS